LLVAVAQVEAVHQVLAGREVVLVGFFILLLHRWVEALHIQLL
jgi:hypothetical protein